MQGFRLHGVHAGGEAQVGQDLMPRGHGATDLGVGAIEARGDLLGVMIVRGQCEQGSGLLDRLLGHLVFFACALERRQLLVELLAGRRLRVDQVLDTLMVLLREHELGIRRAERGGLGPQAGDPGPHLLLLPLDGPPRLLQRGHRGLDLVPSLIESGAGGLQRLYHPVHIQLRLLQVRPHLVDRDLERLAIEADQDRPALDVVVVMDQHLFDDVG